jgi:hypothetical protein
MAIKDRLKRLESDAPRRCPECMPWGDAFRLQHDPAVCDAGEKGAGFPRVRSLARAGWFRTGEMAREPGRYGPKISEEVKRAIESGAIDLGDEKDPNPDAIASIAKLNPHLWRCPKRFTESGLPERCPECGYMPLVVGIRHTYEAGVT